MYKKTSTIMALAIITILTAYMSALSLSNQAFAQCNGTECRKPFPGGGVITIDNGLSRVQTSESLASQHVEHILAGHEAQDLGKILEGQNGRLGASSPCPNLSPANQLADSGDVFNCAS